MKLHHLQNQFPVIATNGHQKLTGQIKDWRVALKKQSEENQERLDCPPDLLPIGDKRVSRILRNLYKRQWMLILGPSLSSHWVETWDFQADEPTDIELGNGSTEQTTIRLLAARGSADEALKEIERGYWGDFRLGQFDLVRPGPKTSAWTKTGSPGWLHKFIENEKREKQRELWR